MALKGVRQTEQHRKKISEALKLAYKEGRLKVPDNRGRKHSEETKRRLSESHKGQRPWMVGKHHTDKTKKKISDVLKGRKLSEEHRRKISKGLNGHIVSEESRLKIGIKNSIALKGKKVPLERRIRISNSLKGERNHRWKGGKTSESRQIRRGIEYRLWREAVFVRDNWICQKCGIKSGCGKSIYLHSHHIQNFSDYPELRTSIENGITFCRECHKEFHKIYGFKNNNEEQVIKFLALDKG